MQFIQKNVLACKMLISNIAGELLHATTASKKVLCCYTPGRNTKYENASHPTLNSLFIVSFFTRIPGSKTKE